MKEKINKSKLEFKRLNTIYRTSHQDRGTIEDTSNHDKQIETSTKFKEVNEKELNEKEANTNENITSEEEGNPHFEKGCPAAAPRRQLKLLRPVL